MSLDTLKVPGTAGPQKYLKCWPFGLLLKAWGHCVTCFGVQARFISNALQCEFKKPLQSVESTSSQKAPI